MKKKVMPELLIFCSREWYIKPAVAVGREVQDRSTGDGDRMQIKERREKDRNRRL